MVKSATHTKFGSAAAVLLAITSAGLGCESILGLTPGKGLCEGVTCQQAQSPCQLPSICDKDTGKCSHPVMMDKTPCDDGDPCTTGDACQGGVCMPGAPVTCATKQCYGAGTCLPGIGCDYGVALPNGESCDDGNECTTGDACQMGKCTGAHAAGGSPCGFGDSCTTEGKCMGGVCMGVKTDDDGKACNDGTVCTSNDMCKGGICSPSTDRSWALWDLASNSPSPRFRATDNLVYDRLTHLTWQRLAPPDVLSWQTAATYCNSLSLAGYTRGWRLPTRIELASIVDYSRQGPSLDTKMFKGDNLLDKFWTSSVMNAQGGLKWVINFSSGYVSSDSPTTLHLLRCVR